MPYRRLLAKVPRLLLFLTAASVLICAAWATPQYKVLYGFTGTSDGGGLWGSVVFDKKANLYGTTSGGGAHGQGTVFKLKHQPSGQWTEKVLHSFQIDDDGYSLNGGLTFDPTGDLYGVTTLGGPFGHGTAFQMRPKREGWLLTILYSFCAQPNCSDGGSPYAGPLRDADGNLYGTNGSVYELSPGPGGWTESVLYTFCSDSKCPNGEGPYAGLVLDAKGNLFGTTEYGGIYPPQCPVGNGCGVVYKLRHMPDGTWKQRVLHTFASFPNDGVKPAVGALAFDGDGKLYGTTNQGGKNVCDTTYCGTIFRLTRQPNGHWKETILYNFRKGSSGKGPGAGVVIDRAGNLYGTTIYGGTQCDCGVVYKLAPNPDGTWTYTVLHQFTGFDGAQPDANLILDEQGNLYGTTSTGGPGGAGVVFQITP
jgi:uncharacterized repeat protein (TIGR03803 family)